jgi:hypothetical protein
MLRPAVGSVYVEEQKFSHSTRNESQIFLCLPLVFAYFELLRCGYSFEIEDHGEIRTARSKRIPNVTSHMQ